MEGLLGAGVLQYAIKIFDLRKSEISIVEIIETQITHESLALPWISEIGQHLQGTPFADDPISSRQIHWVATSAAREHENKSLIRPTIKELPPNTPLQMVIQMEHGLIILPSDDSDLLKYAFVIFEGRQLVAVAKQNVICNSVQDKLSTSLQTGRKETVRFAIEDKLVAPDQTFETAAGLSRATYCVANAITIREVVMKLDILEIDCFCVKMLTCVTSETVCSVRRRIEALMRKEGMLSADEDIALLDPATYCIVPPTSIIQSILNTYRFGQATAALLGGRGFGQNLELKVIRKPPQAFQVTVAVGSREIPIFVTSSTCVFDVKQLVTQIVDGASVGQLKMTMGSRELDDSATVERIGLRSGRTLYITMREPITVYLCRELPCGGKENHTVRVYRGDSIKELKARASLLLNLPESQISFRKDEQWFEEEETLKAFDLQNKDEILVCYLPHKVVLRMYHRRKGPYNVFFTDSRHVTVKWLLDDAAQRFGLEGSMLFVVQHQGNVILSEYTSIKDIDQSSKLSVHSRPSIDAPECKDDRLQYRFIASEEPSVGIKAQLVTVIQGKTFVYIDDCSEVSITSSNNIDDSRSVKDSDLKSSGLNHSTETSDGGTAVSQEKKGEFNKNVVAQQSTSQPTQIASTSHVMPLNDVCRSYSNLRDCSRSDSSYDIGDDVNCISRELESEQSRSLYNVNMRDSGQAEQAAVFLDPEASLQSPLSNIQSPPYTDPHFPRRFQQTPNETFRPLPMQHGSEEGNGRCCPPPGLQGQCPRIGSEFGLCQFEGQPQYCSEPIPRHVSGVGEVCQLSSLASPSVNEPNFEDDPDFDSASQTALHPVSRLAFSPNCPSRSVVNLWTSSAVGHSEIDKKRFRKAKRTAARMIGDRWADLARCLELEEGDIQKIRKEFDGNISDQCNNMLDLWTQRVPSAGVEGLREALEELQRNDILEKIGAIYDNLDSCSDVSSFVGRS